MTPAMITAFATLIAEAASAGVQISEILSEARATGKVPPEQWAKIRSEIDSAEQAWKQA